MATEAYGAHKDFMKRTNQLKKRDHLAPALVEFLEKVHEAQTASSVSLDMPSDEELSTAEQVILGKALLERDKFPFDAKAADDLLNRLLDIMESQDGEFPAAAAVIRAELDSGDLTTEAMYKALLADDLDFFQTWAEKTPDAPMTVRFLAQSALTPALVHAADTLKDKLPEMKARQEGGCPICGSAPLISSLHGKEGARHMTCSFCAHEYRIRRIACAFCGEDDQKQLRFFTAKEEQGYRVDVCSTCKAYIKTIDFRELDKNPVPALDDLDSLTLDHVAGQQGYFRLTLSAWGF